MVNALRAGDLEAAENSLSTVAKNDIPLMQIGRRLLDRFQARDASVASASIDPATIPGGTSSIAVSRLKPSLQKVGWGRPMYDRVLGNEILLSLGGDYFAEGIYAHAPAEHQYQIDGKWKALKGSCGLQTGHRGKVDFEIRGDGRLLWSKRGVTEDAPTQYEVDLTGVDQLALIVTESDNGGGADWGVWIEPTLVR
jgi:hypothetical protein